MSSTDPLWDDLPCLDVEALFDVDHADALVVLDGISYLDPMLMLVSSLMSTLMAKRLL